MLTEKCFSHSGLETNYALSRDGGSPLILLHGVTRRWQTFLPLMASFSTHRQIFATDFRGHGKSGNAKEEYLVTDYVSDTILFVEQFDKPVTLYGHSLGALVATAVAAEVPDKINAVILEDPPLTMMGDQISKTILHSFFKGIQKYVGDKRAVNEIAKDLFNMRLLNPVNREEILLGDIRDLVSLRFTARCLQQLDPAVLKPIVDGRWQVGYESESIFRRISCPTLLMQADPESGGMLSDEEAIQVTDWSENITRIKFLETGHLIHWSSTQKLINLVLGFLETV